jgi:hypothetical protein
MAFDAALSRTLTQGLGVLTGLQEKFSWREVAIAAVSAPIASYVGGKVGGGAIAGSAQRFVGDVASNLSSAAVRVALGGKVDTASIVVDAFGNALANSIVARMSGPVLEEVHPTAKRIGGYDDELEEVHITARYIGPDAEIANARLDSNLRNSNAMTPGEVATTGAARVPPGGGIEEVIVEAQKLTRPQELLYDRLISPWSLTGGKNEYEAMAIVDTARRYDIRYETSASIENDRALINMGLMTIGGAAAGVFGTALYPTILAYSSSPLLAGAASGVAGDVAFQGYQNALFEGTDGSYGRSGIDGTELALSAGFGALPLLPAAIRGWADDLRGLGVPDWNIRLSSPGTLYSNGIGLQLERIGSIPSGFANADDFVSFGQNLRTGLGKVGYADVEPILQGSAVTGKSFRTGEPFDVGRVSDFDVALAGDSVFEAARRVGVPLRSGATRTGPLTERNLRQLGLYDLSQQMSTQAGRPVNFMIYNSTESAMQRAPSALFPR